MAAWGGDLGTGRCSFDGRMEGKNQRKSLFFADLIE